MDNVVHHHSMAAEGRCILLVSHMNSRHVYKIHTDYRCPYNIESSLY